MLKKYSKGFTLIELLVVIGILGILLAIVLIALNPARQFAQANNTKRSSDISTILNAIHQYAADHKGTLPSGMPAPAAIPVPTEIGSGALQANICAALVPTYIAALPVDPSTDAGVGQGVQATDCATYTSVGYQVSVDTAGRVTVDALLHQQAISGQTVNISVTR